MNMASVTTPTLPPGSSIARESSTSRDVVQDEFLTLFIASMRNQDPLSPMDATEMTAQLAQFSSLEQLAKLNETFRALQSISARTEQLAQTSLAVTMIGKQVVALGNTVVVDENGDLTAKFHVGAGGGNAVLRIFDAQGREIASHDLGFVHEGDQTIAWDNTGLVSGMYSYRVEVLRDDGIVVPVEEYTVAQIDQIHFGAAGILLSSGSLFIPMVDVLTVSE